MEAAEGPGAAGREVAAQAELRGVPGGEPDRRRPLRTEPRRAQTIVVQADTSTAISTPPKLFAATQSS